MMFKTISISLMISSILFLTGCVYTPSTSTHQRSPAPQLSKPHFNLTFSHTDRSAIREYYHSRSGHFKRIPPGQYKKQRRFHRHKPLPKGMRYEPLPRHLERRLNPLPVNYIRIRIGNDFGIMNIKTRVIYDAFYELD